MDTAPTSTLGDVTTLFTALWSVQSRARLHLIQLDELTSVVSQMNRRAQGFEVRQELTGITRVLSEVRALMFDHETVELSRAVLTFAEVSAVAPETLAKVADDVAALLDQCLCMSDRVDGLLLQSARRLSELDAAEV